MPDFSSKGASKRDLLGVELRDTFLEDVPQNRSKWTATKQTGLRGGLSVGDQNRGSWLFCLQNPLLIGFVWGEYSTGDRPF